VADAVGDGAADDARLIDEFSADKPSSDSSLFCLLIAFGWLAAGA
jgi:hypothetical protein